MTVFVYKSRWSEVDRTIVVPGSIELAVVDLQRCSRLRTLIEKLSFFYSVIVLDDKWYNIYVNAQKALTEYSRTVVHIPINTVFDSDLDIDDAVREQFEAYSQDEWLCFLLDNEAFLDLNVDEDQPPSRIKCGAADEPFFRYLNRTPPRTYRNITLGLDSKWDTVFSVSGEPLNDKLTAAQLVEFYQEATIVGVSSYQALGGSNQFPKWLARRIGLRVSALPSTHVLPVESELENQDFIFVSVKVPKKLETALL